MGMLGDFTSHYVGTDPPINVAEAARRLLLHLSIECSLDYARWCVWYCLSGNTPTGPIGKLVYAWLSGVDEEVSE